jgi:hypothetical protein
MGSVEILEKPAVALLGLFAPRASAPAASGIPHIAIIIRRLMKNLNKRGGKGMLPTCCLPLWGREGVTLMAAAENKRITQKKEDFNKANR